MPRWLKDFVVFDFILAASIGLGWFVTYPPKWFVEWHEPFWMRMATIIGLLAFMGWAIYQRGTWIRENAKHVTCPHCGKDIEIPIIDDLYAGAP